jgi:hypothetical protein
MLLRLVLILSLSSIAQVVVEPQAFSSGKPDWVEGKSKDYPEEAFLTGVGYGEDRKSAEDAAYAAVSRIFQAEIDSVSRDWEKYSQTEAAGKTRVSRDVQIDQTTSVATRKVLESVSIAQVWNDEKTKRLYALAVMDRSQARAALQEKIAVLDKDLADLKGVVQGTTNKIDRVRIYRKLLNMALAREIYNADLRVINPSGHGEEATDSLVLIRQGLQDVLYHDIHIGVEIQGDENTLLRSFLVEGLTREGFSVLENGDPSEMDILIKGTVDFRRTESPPWTFVRWVMTVDLVDHKSGKIFGSLTKSGREGQLNDTEAERAAVRAIHREVIQTLGGRIVSFIYGEES